MSFRNTTLDIHVNPQEKCEHSSKRIQLTKEVDHVAASSSGSKTRASDDTVAPGSSNITDSDENQCETELNNYVLGHIFSFLDLRSLKNCRLVSKIWNEESSLLLGDKYWFKLNWQKFLRERDEIISFSDYDYSNFSQLIMKQGEKEIEKLFECLSNLYNPSIFGNFEFDFEWLLKKKFQELLEKFGLGLKRIIICDMKETTRKNCDVNYSARLEIVCRILTKWCPILSNFQMHGARKPSELALPMEIKWIESNKIQELKMEGILTEYQYNFWIQLIKACPCLSKLNISCIPQRKTQRFERNRPEETLTCESFFEKLSKLPEVTKKLEKFSWNGACDRFGLSDLAGYPSHMYLFLTVEETSCNILKPVSNMEFSNKLKKIGIGPSIDSLNCKERYLTRLLEKLNACGTEEIVLKGKYWKPLPPGDINNDGYEWYDPDASCSGTEDESDPCECEEDEHTLECFSRIDHIPQMPKVTSIKSSATYNYQLGPFHFVRKFPNLKKYEMPGNSDSGFWPLEELHYLCKFPHYNLETLIVHPTVDDIKTLECITQSFPNLKSLEFEVYSPKDASNLSSGKSSPEPNEMLFKEVLGFLSKCEHLQELTVLLESEYSPKDLCDALRVVKDFPKLDRITLNGRDYSLNISFLEIKGSPFEPDNLCVFHQL